LKRSSPSLASDAILCTDGSRAMIGVARKIGITHRPVNLAAGIRVISKVYHVQNVNAYGSRLTTLRTISAGAGILTATIPKHPQLRSCVHRWASDPFNN
jgi:hypothetical protein